MKRVISLLLIIAMLFSVCAVFTACGDTDSVSDQDDEKEKEKRKPTMVFEGLEIVLPKSFEKSMENGGHVQFANDDYTVRISCMPLNNALGVFNDEDLRDYYLDMLDLENAERIEQWETGEKNGTYYLCATGKVDGRKAGAVYAFYAVEEYGWVVCIDSTIENEQFDIHEMIRLVTGWKCTAPAPETTDPTEDTTEPEETVGPIDDEYITLTWCFPDGLGAADYPEWDRILEAINEITRREINANIEIELIPLSEYTDRMHMKYVANEKWDICFSSSLWNNYADAVENGVFAELPMNFLAAYASGTVHTLNPHVWDAVKVNGGIYGIPVPQLHADQGGICFETQWAEELGFDWQNVTCLEDLEPYFAMLQANGYSECFFFGGESMLNSMQAWMELDYLVDSMTPGAVHVFDDRCQVINQFNTDKFRQLARLMYSWHSKGYFTDAAYYADQYNWNFAEGRQPVTLVSSTAPGEDALATRDNGIAIQSIPLGTGVITTADVNVAVMAISSNSDNPGRAAAFIDLLNTNEELLNLILHGQEGHDWHWLDEDQKLIEIQEYAYPGNFAFFVGNDCLEYYVDPVLVGTNEAIADRNASAKGSAILGFTYDPGDNAEILVKLHEIIFEQLGLIMCGMAGDPDMAIEKLNADLYAAGLQFVLDDMQAQIDQWMASR